MQVLRPRTQDSVLPPPARIYIDSTYSLFKTKDIPSWMLIRNCLYQQLLTD